MALITKIRQKAGIAVGLVAMGLILFLVGDDIIRPNSRILGKSQVYIGEIDGVKIKYQDYVTQVEEMKNNFQLNFGRTPAETDMYTIRQQAWDFLIVQHAFQKQFDILGVEVTEEELVDMVQGNNIHPDIVQAFTNPETGEFNPEQIVTYLQNINQMPEQQQAIWFMFERNLLPSRLRIKYDNMLLNTTYITEEEARKQYEFENSVAEIRYMYIPYYTVTDSVNITEDMLETYLNEHEKDYKTEESRNISFVTFPIVPSSEDSMVYKNDIDKLAREFSTIDDDSIFAYANSDGTTYFRVYNVSQLPVKLRDRYKTLSKGEVIGPYLQGGNYVVHKITDIFQDSVEYARASHILVSPASQSAEDKLKAKNEANQILGRIRGGADFAMTARDNSDDPSSSAGGDLGWFSRDRMVEPFSDAVFSAAREGLIPRVIETDFGYHLINVTQAKTRSSYKVSTIEREVSASDYTKNEAFRKADLFLAEAGNYAEFKKTANQDSLSINDADDLDKDARTIPGLGEAREIVRWAFSKASVGQVSEIFELENSYVIAVLTKVTDAGITPLDEIKDELTQKVMNDLKAEIIIKKLDSLSGTLDEVASAYGNDANIYSTADLRLSSNTLPNVGFTPTAIGIAFSMTDGQRSAPLKENNGILIIEMQALTKAPEIADYTSYKNQLQQRRSGTTSYLLSETVKKFANISDDRYKYY